MKYFPLLYDVTPHHIESGATLRTGQRAGHLADLRRRSGARVAWLANRRPPRDQTRVITSPPRRRLPYAGLLVATILLGLATRRFPDQFPTVVATYGGDTLWAMMVVWLLAIARPTATRLSLAGNAFAIATAIECSQLYRAPWIDAWRATTLGALVLGQGFLWSDLLCYAVGVALAAVVDRAITTS